MCLWGYAEIELDDPPPKPTAAPAAAPKGDYILADSKLYVPPTIPTLHQYHPRTCICTSPYTFTIIFTLVGILHLPCLAINMATNGEWNPGGNSNRHRRNPAPHAHPTTLAGAGILRNGDAARPDGRRVHFAGIAAVGAPDDWMDRFDDGDFAADPLPPHNWRQNYAPGDFLPFSYDVEQHIRRLGLGGDPNPPQCVPLQPAAVRAASSTPMHDWIQGFAPGLATRMPPSPQLYPRLPTAPAVNEWRPAERTLAAPDSAHPPTACSSRARQPQYYQTLPMTPGLANVGGPGAQRAALQAAGYPPNMQLVPEIATPNTRYIVKEKADGAFTERTVNEIMANFQPGHWARSRIGALYWIQH